MTTDFPIFAEAADADIMPTTPEDDILRARWRVSLHEAAHVVAVVKLGWCIGYAAVLNDDIGGGVAAYTLPDGASGCPFRRALVAMAGPCGEELAADIAPPAMAATEVDDLAEQRDAGRFKFCDLNEKTQAGVVADNAGGESDMDVVRQYALAPSDWREWSLRAAGLHRQCMELLSDNRALWLAIATVLYCDGLIVSTQVQRLVNEHAPWLREELFQEVVL